VRSRADFTALVAQNPLVKDLLHQGIEKFIKILSDLTGWKYNQSNWTWENLKLYKFTKGDFTGKKIRLNNKTFEKLLSKKPLTWAMTNGQNIEYTLEKPDKL